MKKTLKNSLYLRENKTKYDGEGTSVKKKIGV